jgi:dTDP-D-glucose 4,6-dehydratase
MSKTILITGASGFVMHHVVEHVLKNTDWRIVCIDRLNSPRKNGYDRLRDIKVFDDTRVERYMHNLNLPFSEGLKMEIGEVNYFLNGASGSHVDNSITSPVEFVQNNVNIALHGLEYARELNERGCLEKYHAFSTDECFGTAPFGVDYNEGDRHNPGNPYASSKSCQESITRAYANTYKIPCIVTNCWDMGTKLFTKDGLKGYDEVSEGDLVWTLDKDENLVLEPIQAKVKMKGPDQMYKFKHYMFEQFVTPNHRIMFKRPVGKNRKYGEIEECHAEKLFGMKNRIRIPLTGKWEGDDSYMPKEFDKFWLAEVLGWFVSEGWCNQWNGISFGAGKESQYVELENLLESYNPVRRGRSVNILDKEKKLKTIIKKCGHLAENKVVPDFIKYSSVPVLEKFFRSAMMGDGANFDTDGQQKVYYTKSKQLAMDMMEIGMKLGYGVRLSERETYNPGKTILSKSYIVRFHKAYADLEKKNILKEEYNGDVWCVSVPSGRVFTSRDGGVVLTGQTMNVLGERQDPEKFLPKIINYVLEGKTLSIHSDPTKTQAGLRHYIHARNIGSAILHIYEHSNEILHNVDASMGVFNIVGEKEYDNLELAKLVASYVGKPLKYEMVDFHSSRPGHDLRYSLSGKKMYDLGWRHPVSIEDSIKKIVEWTLKEENKKWLRE